MLKYSLLTRSVSFLGTKSQMSWVKATLATNSAVGMSKATIGLNGMQSDNRVGTECFTNFFGNNSATQSLQLVDRSCTEKRAKHWIKRKRTRRKRQRFRKRTAVRLFYFSRFLPRKYDRANDMLVLEYTGKIIYTRSTGKCKSITLFTRHDSGFFIIIFYIILLFIINWYL